MKGLGLLLISDSIRASTFRCLEGDGNSCCIAESARRDRRNLAFRLITPLTLLWLTPPFGADRLVNGRNA